MTLSLRSFMCSLLKLFRFFPIIQRNRQINCYSSRRTKFLDQIQTIFRTISTRNTGRAKIKKIDEYTLFLYSQIYNLNSNIKQNKSSKILIAFCQFLIISFQNRNNGMNKIWEYESEHHETSTGFFEIQKTKKTLDELELKLKSYKKQKQNRDMSNNPSLYFSQFKDLESLQSPFPNLQHYLTSLLSQSLPPQSQNIPSKQYEKQKPQNWLHQINSQYNTQIEPQFGKTKTKYDIQEKKPKKYENSESMLIKKHTEQQLEKSQVAHLQKLHNHYRLNCQDLDNKISALEKQKAKIKQDKVLLMRDNQELELKIEEEKKKKSKKVKEKQGQQSPETFLLTNLNSILSKLSKKLAKIELENNRIVQRKKNLQISMRMCLKNSQQQLKRDLLYRSRNQKTKPKSIKNSKSRSYLTRSAATYSGIHQSSKCPYH